VPGGAGGMCKMNFKISVHLLMCVELSIKTGKTVKILILFLQGAAGPSRPAGPYSYAL